MYCCSTRKSEIPGTGWWGPGERHYGTLTVAQIAALPVAEHAADDAMLFLWVVNSQLPRCLSVVEAWGFDYRGLITWAKTGKPGGALDGRPNFGMGYWVRGATEHMVIGVRGKPKPQSRCEVSWFAAPVGEHSVKPDEAYALVERLSSGPRLELFARRRRPGWEAWGNEVDGSFAFGSAAE